METEAYEFIRSVVLSDNAPMYMKEEALELLMRQASSIDHADNTRRRFAVTQFRISREDWNKIQEAIDAGQKIPAIKILRAASGMGLRDSKLAVENDSYFRQPKLRLST